mmetsp:Transcript_58974/g.95428  ORF Transcript_58974/g.95428 Transcript_58974/m.95428 type:complete len:260 (-) Transcript_58974:36-815(-)
MLWHESRAHRRPRCCSFALRTGMKAVIAASIGMGCQTWVSISFRRGVLSKALLGGVLLAGSLAPPATAVEPSDQQQQQQLAVPSGLKLPAPGRRVLDLGGLLPAALEQELETAIDLLEKDTPYRFRLFTPPPGFGPEDKFGWPKVVKAVGQYFALESQWDAGSAVVLVASPRSSAGRMANPLTFSVARKLTEKLQYRIASDLFVKISNKFGDTQLVARIGDGEAAAGAALNAIACLRKGACMQPLPEEEARALAFPRQP